MIEATRLLAAASETPRLDAELLMAHALGIDRDALLLGPDHAVPPAFATLVERRAAGEPCGWGWTVRPCCACSSAP